MLGSLLKSVWRRISGNAVVAAPRDSRSAEGPLQSEVRAAFASLLREPLAHPKTVDYEMVAHLMAATSSAQTVLQLLTPRVVSGTVILFDEYLNYPAWQQHEFRAFQEFVAQTGKGYRYIGFASSDCAVAVKML